MARPSLALAVGVVALSALVGGCGGSASVPPGVPVPPSASGTPGTPAPTGVAGAGTPPGTAKGGDWTTYHRDPQRTGAAPDVPALGQLGRAWTAGLDGQVYASPLVVAGRVIAATTSNTVYALDRADGHVLWRTHVAEPARRSQLPCGNVDPAGIIGTPVYDPTSGLVFAVAQDHDTLGHVLVGVDVGTGAVKVRRVVDPPGSSPVAQQERAALALSKGKVYVALGGLLGDCGPYHGYVVSSATDGTGALGVYQVPSPREAGIWAASGPAVDPASGDLFVAVGNGESTDSYDYSNSVLRLSPDLRLVGSFSPAQWAQDNARDADLGSMGPLLLPFAGAAAGRVYADGKNPTGYLLAADHLGGIGGALQTQQVCVAFGGAAYLAGTVYVPCTGGVSALAYDEAAGRLGGVRWRAPDGVIGSPVVGGGAVWALDPSAGALYALDPASGAVRAKVTVGAATRFATPALSGGLALVGTKTGVTAVSGA